MILSSVNSQSFSLSINITTLLQVTQEEIQKLFLNVNAILINTSNQDQIKASGPLNYTVLLNSSVIFNPIPIPSPPSPQPTDSPTKTSNPVSTLQPTDYTIATTGTKYYTPTSNSPSTSQLTDPLFKGKLKN